MADVKQYPALRQSAIQNPVYSHSEENYLKTIFHLEQMSESGVQTNAIAGQLDTKASSVTDMLKRLADKKLVNYVKYQGVTLTITGRKKALSIIRKHRLWEVFLVEKLRFSWDEVHQVAEQLEHIQSDKLTEQLAKHLGHPKFDPHGDPIPTKDGKFHQRDKVLLSEVEEKSTGVCVGVKDTSSSFLRFLDKNGIALGKKIKILEREAFDGSMQIALDGKKMTLSKQVASNLYIKI